MSSNKTWTRETLYRIPVFGGTPTKVLEWLDSPSLFHPTVNGSPGVRGSFPSEGESALMIANVDGANEQVLAKRKRPEAFAPIFFTGPSWSPDGELIACTVSNVTGPSHLFAFTVNGGKERDLTPNGLPFIARSQWLADMSGLLMIAGTSPSESQVWLLSYPDRAMRPVTNDLDQHRDIGLSAQADKFVSVVATGLVNVFVVPEGNSDRAVQLPVGNLSFYGSGGNSVAWTPDGRIIFASNESSTIDLWIMDADGSQRKQLTSNSGEEHRTGRIRGREIYRFHLNAHGARARSGE
jgi:Tol biopolymer transport system component